MNPDTKFIRTTDTDTRDVLMKLGFKLINSDNSSWTFLNSDKLVFSDNKVIYTDILNC